MKQFFVLVSMLLLTSFAQAGEQVDESDRVIYMGENGVIVLSLETFIDGKNPHQLFEQYVEDLMTSLDADHDGVLTLEETKGHLLTAVDAAQAQLVTRSGAVVNDLSPDTSPRDGKVTKAELLTYFKRIGLNPFAMVYQPRSNQQGGARRARQPNNLPEVPLFARLDSNGDGKLSTEELAGALQTMRKLDLDDDETISEAELNPVGNANMGVVQQQPNAQAVSTSPFLGPGSDESLPKQVRRLIDRYDSTDPAKSGVEGARVRNQKLSAMELGIPAETLKRYDGDSDGQLDFDELRQFLASPEITISVTIRIDSKDPLKAETNRDDLRGKLRTAADGSANINLGTTQLSVARGSANDLGTAESYLKPQFMFADADANGYLEKSEANRVFLYGATFENLDTDKNGKVFLDEAIAYFKIRFDAARSRTILTIDEQGRTLFEILDTDRDRRLSFRELQTAANKLALWDMDGDGMLSESEIPMQYRLVASRGVLPSMGGMVSVNGQNQAGGSNDRSAGPVWFRKMDRNRDGEVSAREFLLDSATFEALDRNHDGFIDLQEALYTPAE